MELPLLPECRWRGPEDQPGWYACSSTMLMVSRRGVPADFCRKCGVANHEPSKPVETRPATQISVVVGPPAEPKPLHEAPGWFRKALNFGRAVVKHAWHGLPETTTPEQERRLSVCLNCLPPEGYLDVERGICTHKDCGCAVTKKTTWMMERCPIGKW